MIADKDESDQAADERLSQRISARRRLLRGSFAVPTVLTLSSGSALAGSSSLHCFNNSLPVISNPPDNYFRVPRYAYATVDGTTTYTVYLVKAADIVAESTNRFDASTFLTGKGDWIKVSDGSSYTAAVPADLPAEVGKFVALQFAVAGEANPVFTLTGLVNSDGVGTGSGKVLTHSCWASI